MMNSQIIRISITALSCIFMLSLLAFADPEGRANNKSTPPGWKQGEKAGWQEEDRPPGLNEDKLEKKQKARMKGEEAKARMQEQSKKTKQEAVMEKEEVEQEAEIEKKKREAEMKKEQEKMKAK